MSYPYAPDPVQRQPSPYGSQPQPFSTPTGGQVAPGSVTYTTSTGPDGRLLYHSFKAVPASYQTPSGVVTGIQWVPTEATNILPVGAQPANAEFAASWSRGPISSKDQKAIKGWQKEEEKRRKKEEKEASKRLRDKDREDPELRRARERDALAHERRKSVNAGSVPPGVDPGYPNLYSGYGNYSPATGTADLDRRFGDLGFRDEDKQRSSAHVSSTYSPNATVYPTPIRPTAYTAQGVPYRPPSRAPSPNVRPMDIPRSTTPVPGTMAGSGVTGFPQASIPMSSGSPYTPPRNIPIEPQPQQPQLAAPEAFSRPVNAALSYTPFETIKIQDMDDFIDNLPRMPLVLPPHDVYHDDWIRFVQDLTRAWMGTLPIAELVDGRVPKRATLTADLINIWNKSFFNLRGVEVALYKGREKRSGPDAGTIDNRLPSFDADELSSSSSSASSEDSDLSGEERYGQSGHGFYGRQGHFESTEARQRRKAEKKRHAKEKKLRKKAKERAKTYALYLICVPRGGPAFNPGYPPMGGRSSPMPTAYDRAAPVHGRTSPMPGNYARTGPMPGDGRTSPMPGGYNPVGGRMSPMPTGRASPMPAPYVPLGGRSSPMPGGRY